MVSSWIVCCFLLSSVKVAISFVHGHGSNGLVVSFVDCKHGRGGYVAAFVVHGHGRVGFVAVFVVYAQGRDGYVATSTGCGHGRDGLGAAFVDNMHERDDLVVTPVDCWHRGDVLVAISVENIVKIFLVRHASLVRKVERLEKANKTSVKEKDMAGQALVKLENSNTTSENEAVKRENAEVSLKKDTDHSSNAPKLDKEPDRGKILEATEEREASRAEKFENKSEEARNEADKAIKEHKNHKLKARKSRTAIGNLYRKAEMATAKDDNGIEKANETAGEIEKDKNPASNENNLKLQRRLSKFRQPEQNYFQLQH